MGNPWERQNYNFAKPLYLRAKSALSNQIFVTKLATVVVLKDFLRDTLNKINDNTTQRGGENAPFFIRETHFLYIVNQRF